MYDSMRWKCYQQYIIYYNLYILVYIYIYIYENFIKIKKNKKLTVTVLLLTHNVHKFLKALILNAL